MSHESIGNYANIDVIYDTMEVRRMERAAALPTEQDAIGAIHLAYQRLQDLGWLNVIYCPKDGTLLDVIEAGSTGIHTCSYLGEWPRGSFMIHSDGDLLPSNPILFREKAVRRG